MSTVRPGGVFDVCKEVWVVDVGRRPKGLGNRLFAHRNQCGTRSGNLNREHIGIFEPFFQLRASVVQRERDAKQRRHQVLRQTQAGNPRAQCPPHSITSHSDTANTIGVQFEVDLPLLDVFASGGLA